MARIIYALSGQGRGHTSRVIAISDELRRKGHEVIFCCGGTAQEILESEGENVISVPALRQIMQGNQIQHGKTIACNWKYVVGLPDIVARLADEFSRIRPDLLITDFEAFSPKAARRLGLPVLSFNHQQVVTETRYDLPASERVAATLAGMAIRLIAPSRPEHILLTSFFFPPLRHPEYTTLVPPIIRPVVKAATPSKGEHILVYYNQPEGAEYVLDTLRRVNAPFIVYNFGQPAEPQKYPNIQFKEPSLDGFLKDLAACRAIICTAGFTLISEALYLGKPLLAVPNRGIFEQTINALFLVRDQLGEAVLSERLTPQDIEGFLNRCPLYDKKLQGRRTSGNEEAIACIEDVLSRIGPRSFVRPTFPMERVNGGITAGTAVKSD
jgi:uncharacterized protein (TIGR00661 family)